jgi:FkbM family methyltransferase
MSFEGEKKYEDYQDRRLDLIAGFLPENPVIFEAGGHDGSDTFLFYVRWPASKIITFEPHPVSFQKLLEKTAWISRVEAHNLAVNTINGQTVLQISLLNDGASSILTPVKETEELYQGPKIVVPCVVLDDWCQENQIEAIDFMWLDLEGLELQILRSSPQILSTVKVIYTETNLRLSRMGMTRYQELKAFLEKSGFKLIAHWYQENLQGDAIFVRI